MNTCCESFLVYFRCERLRSIVTRRSSHLDSIEHQNITASVVLLYAHIIITPTMPNTSHLNLVKTSPVLPNHISQFKLPQKLPSSHPGPRRPFPLQLHRSIRRLQPGLRRRLQLALRVVRKLIACFALLVVALALRLQRLEPLTRG